eukprot:6388785-Alexandrium_andersonii.AAC.1
MERPPRTVGPDRPGGETARAGDRLPHPAVDTCLLAPHPSGSSPGYLPGESSGCGGGSTH